MHNSRPDPFLRNMARYYNPRTGRYDESDPIGLRGGINTYTYVENNPLTRIDPLGLKEYPDGFIGPLTPSDYYTSQMTQTKCGKVPPAPPTANINSNIDVAEQQYNPVWFYSQVRNKGPWDYKQQGPLYEDFGNFNYGATGTAFGFPDQVLLRAAGAANQIADPSRQNLGTPLGNPPYGDDPNDQTQISNGTGYCKCMQQ